MSKCCADMVRFGVVIWNDVENFLGFSDLCKLEMRGRER